MASKMATKNTSVTNLAITMFDNLQNASFLHISSQINAKEDVYVPLGHFVKIKIQGSLWKCRVVSRFALYLSFAFLKAQTIICQKNG